RAVACTRVLSSIASPRSKLRIIPRPRDGACKAFLQRDPRRPMKQLPGKRIIGKEVRNLAWLRPKPGRIDFDGDFRVDRVANKLGDVTDRDRTTGTQIDLDSDCFICGVGSQYERGNGIGNKSEVPTGGHVSKLNAAGRKRLLDDRRDHGTRRLSRSKCIEWA